MLLLPTPVRQTAHGYSPELCKRSRPVPQIMTFVFPAFTLNPFFSMTSFHIKSLLTHSSRESAIGVGKKSVFKRMIQGALKFQGLRDLGHGPLSNFQKFTCTQFVGAIYVN